MTEKELGHWGRVEAALSTITQLALNGACAHKRSFHGSERLTDYSNLQNDRQRLKLTIDSVGQVD